MWLVLWELDATDTVRIAMPAFSELTWWWSGWDMQVYAARTTKCLTKGRGSTLM